MKDIDQDASAAFQLAIFTLERALEPEPGDASLLMQMAAKSEAEIMADTGMFNEIFKGYLAAAMQATEHDRYHGKTFEAAKNLTSKNTLQYI